MPPELDIAILGLLQKELGKRTQNAGELRSRLCLLRDAAAPFPHGKGELAAYVEAALAARKAVAAAG